MTPPKATPNTTSNQGRHSKTCLKTGSARSAELPRTSSNPSADLSESVRASRWLAQNVRATRLVRRSPALRRDEVGRSPSPDPYHHRDTENTENSVFNVRGASAPNQFRLDIIFKLSYLAKWHRRMVARS